MSQTACLIGASGLVGGQVLRILLADPLYDKVRILVRKSLDLSDPKLEQVIVDFGDEKKVDEQIAGAETVFCAVGTTNAKVSGDKEAYKRVDFDIPVYAARAAAKYGVYGFVLVSSVGADPENNQNFYLKLKGVTEEAITKEVIPQILIFRPSLLLGPRKERRFGERAAQLFAPIFSPLLPRSKNKYKPIEASTLAQAMVNGSQQIPKGIHILEYPRIMELAKK